MARRGTLQSTLALAALVLALGGCDTFFQVRGTLTDCATGIPIAGATVVTATDPGAWGGPETEMTTTDAKGHFEASLDKPMDEAATITFSKSGFVPLSHDFKGLPTWPYQIDFCLDAAAPP